MNAGSGNRPTIGTVVLVEGVSDQRAVRALATRFGRDLAAEGIAVVPMGGATNIGRFVDVLETAGAGLKVTGLCDVREAAAFGRRLGPGDFFVCDVDLEDELIRALGVDAVEQVIEQQHELGSLRILQAQPAQRGRRAEQQLRRFFGSRAGRKIQYAGLLVEALDLSSIPAPLKHLLDHL